MNDYLNQIEQKNIQFEKYKKQGTIVTLVFILIVSVLVFQQISLETIDIHMIINSDTTTIEVKSNSTVGEALKVHNIIIESTDYILLNDKYIAASDVDIIELKHDDIVEVKKIEITFETEEVSIKYKTLNENDLNMDVGEQKVKRAGKNGTLKRTYEVKKFEGEVLSKEIYEETIIKEPIDKIILIGKREHTQEYIPPNNTDSINNVEEHNESNPSNQGNTTNTSNPSNQGNTIEEPKSPTEDCTITINGNTVPCQ
ncbi:G5 domain-containing protein [Mollicutes bacterium LVI A0039]|nr:G5 domain-containing protein [Mollicutes bacterium LVI A0039]